MPNIFLNADCMDPEVGLPSYPDNHFDLAIVDPPYKDDVAGLSVGFNRSKFNYQALSTPPDKKYLKELFRVSKNQILWGFNYYMNLLPNTDNVICWNKHQNGHFSECEYAWSSLKKSRIFDRPYQKDLYNKIHPTQKPKALYCWLLENYAQPNDLILDTHVGSASSLIACESMGFSYVGYELDPDYYAAAHNRMSKGIQLQML
jgi:site-specific DNA-methyltransferase (adenine-specific)